MAVINQFQTFDKQFSTLNIDLSYTLNKLRDDSKQIRQNFNNYRRSSGKVF